MSDYNFWLTVFLVFLICYNVVGAARNFLVLRQVRKLRTLLLLLCVQVWTMQGWSIDISEDDKIVARKRTVAW